MSLAARFPFPSGGKAAAAAPPESRSLDDLDYLIGILIVETIKKCEVPAPGYVLFDVVRINITAISKGYFKLFIVKRGFLKIR